LDGEIQKLYEIYVGETLVEITKMLQKTEKYPPSFMNTYKKLFVGIINYGENKSAKSFLPVFNSMLNVPFDDLKTYAMLYPNLGPIFTGDLQPPTITFIQAIISQINGDTTAFNTKSFWRAVGKSMPYLKEQYWNIIKYIQNFPEQTLLDFVNQGIEMGIAEAVESIGKSNE